MTEQFGFKTSNFTKNLNVYIRKCDDNKNVNKNIINFLIFHLF